jgi:hypothetical protein
LGKWKQPFSREIHELLIASGSPLREKLMVPERWEKTCFRFWQEGPGFDRNLGSAAAIPASRDDIHNNPVQRRLCKQAVDGKWSSARYDWLEPPGPQFPDLPHIHGVPPGALERGQSGGAACSTTLASSIVSGVVQPAHAAAAGHLERPCDPSRRAACRLPCAVSMNSARVRL